MDETSRQVIEHACTPQVVLFELIHLHRMRAGTDAAPWCGQLWDGTHGNAD